jgi:serine/threonine-protein kinase
MNLTKTQIGFPSAPAPNVDPLDPTLADGPRLPVALGDVVGGRYAVERVLAQGGMGVVVAARDVEKGERVAIKFLREDIVTDFETVARFEREARAAGQLKSEHAMKVLDVGTLDNRTPYMVMEFLEGEDLATWLRTRGALRLGHAVDFMLQICQAMSEAHALGFVHRDLKPSNLFVTRRADGRTTIKVLDFGLSKIATDRSVTRRNVAVGSPCYMSPEQLTCAVEIDRRADVWALGVTLFEMLTGTVPFDGDTTAQLCGKILREAPPLVRDLRPNAPEGIERIITRCLEKQREKRYDGAAELAEALAPFAAPRAPSSVRPALAPAPEGFDSTRVVWDEDSRDFLPKRQVRPAFVALGVLALAAFFGLKAWRSSSIGTAAAALPAADPVPAIPSVAPSDVPPPLDDPPALEAPTATPMAAIAGPAASPPPAMRAPKSPTRANPAPKRPAPPAAAAPPSPPPTPKAPKPPSNVFDERN